MPVLIAEAKIMKIEANLWVRKYFKADSTEYLFFLFSINGIKAKRLISKPTQAINHELVEVVTKIEVRRVA